MDQIVDLAATNLLSPIILSFALGIAAALARSDLNIPEAVAKGMSIYLLFVYVKYGFIEFLLIFL